MTTRVRYEVWVNEKEGMPENWRPARASPGVLAIFFADDPKHDNHNRQQAISLAQSIKDVYDQVSVERWNDNLNTPLGVIYETKFGEIKT